MSEEENELDTATLFAEVFDEALTVFEQQKKTGAPDDIAMRNALTPVFIAIELAGLPSLLAMANRLVTAAGKAGRASPHEAALHMVQKMIIGGLGMESMPDAVANVAVAMLVDASNAAGEAHKVDPKNFALAKLAKAGLV